MQAFQLWMLAITVHRGYENSKFPVSKWLVFFGGGELTTSRQLIHASKRRLRAMCAHTIYVCTYLNSHTLLTFQWSKRFTSFTYVCLKFQNEIFFYVQDVGYTAKPSSHSYCGSGVPGIPCTKFTIVVLTYTSG